MTSNTPLGQLMSKYKTKDHFIMAYKSKGKILPREIDFGWNYIRQVVTGEKLLINNEDLKGFKIPPR